MPSQQRSIVRRAWVATGLVLLCLVPVDPPRAEAQATTGSWQLGPDLPFFPIHDHVLPDGKVMMWPGDQGINGDDPRTWDPATGTVTTLPKAGFDIFCSGHSFLPDGRLFVAGGHISNGVGLANTSIYSPAANSWQSQPLMNQGRWYPTTTVLSNGDVLVVSGSVDGTIGSNPVPQVWQASSGTWRNLNSANLQQPLYPYMFLAPDGRGVRRRARRYHAAARHGGRWYLVRRGQSQVERVARVRVGRDVRARQDPPRRWR